MKFIVYNDFDESSTDRDYEVFFLGKEDFSVSKYGIALSKKENEVIVSTGKKVLKKIINFEKSRKYELSYWQGSDDFEIKPYLTKKEAKKAIRDYSYRWDWDNWMHYAFVWCSCGHNEDCPTYGEVVKVPVTELSESGLKKLPKTHYIDEKIVYAPVRWFYEKYLYTDDSDLPDNTERNVRWLIRSDLKDKVEKCPFCSLAYEVQRANNTIPFKYILKERLYYGIENLMVKYMHIFGDYPRFWRNYQRKCQEIAF